MRTEMHVGGPYGVAGLQGVSSLDPSAAADAAAHVDPEATHPRLDLWDVLLILLLDLGLLEILAAAVRTRPDRCLIALVDMVGDRSSCFDAVVFAGLASGTLWVRNGWSLGEGSRLALARPLGFRDALSQLSVLFLQLLDLRL